MHKVKKKSKSAKIPKPIKIKKEKTEEDRTLQPMSHYIDDRLELVKQIFGTLKPKTITNLAPDFLKKKNMEDIQELCLNELLCISTKRLHSIIDATKCPTDTESSSDSDVQHNEEHISLEEISSDSEIEGSTSKKAKNKSKRVDSGSNKAIAKNPNEENQNDGAMSVLELLELQARARAIRSQLALEPVTKIEVDSGDENASKSSKEQTRKRKFSEGAGTSRQSSASNTHSKHAKMSVSNENNQAVANEKEAKPRKSKKIKLKRNYRSGSNSNEEKSGNVSKQTAESNNIEHVNKALKKEKASRSASPDVIPIVAEPETLLITDSSDDDHTRIVAKTKPQADEEQVNKALEKPQKSLEPKEQEEGEITDSEQHGEVAAQSESNEQVESDANMDKVTDEKLITKEEENIEKVASETLPEDKIHYSDSKIMPESTTTVEIVKNVNTELDKQESANLNEQMKPTEKLNEVEAKTVDDNDDDDDRNDDVISIEGGDLESEIEQLEEEQNSKTSYDSKQSYSSGKDAKQRAKHAKVRAAQEDDDIISLESSEDERAKPNSESWHSRYLKSSKVSKVLASARLGKRMRDQIKKSKRNIKDNAATTDMAQNAEKSSGGSSTYTTKHEDGSVEQYKELLEMRQRKN